MEQSGPVQWSRFVSIVSVISWLIVSIREELPVAFSTRGLLPKTGGDPSASEALSGPTIDKPRTSSPLHGTSFKACMKWFQNFHSSKFR